jgi:hypothetical protein
VTDLPALREYLPDKVPPFPALEGPHLELIFHMLCCNIHPYRIAQDLQRKYGVTYDPRVIAEYLAAIPDEDLLPTTSLARHLRNNGVISDPLMELHSLLRYSGERLARQVEIENADGKGLTQATEAALQRHWTRCLQLAQLDVGQSKPTEAPKGEETAPTTRDILASMQQPNKVATVRAVEITVKDDE